jgi:peroxiredoxin family protein
MSEEELARILAVDMVKVSKAAYQSTTTAKAEIFGSEVYVYHQAAGLDTMDASNVKRFVTPIGGGDFRVYTQQVSAKQYVISVEHYSNIVTVKSSGFYAKTIT